MDYSIFRPIREPNIKEGFILLIEELILTGELAPGTRLPSERELAETYGVSRPVIHEAFLLLEKSGLVRLRPRHGVVVNDYRKEATLEVLLSLLGTEEHSPGPGLHRELELFRIQMESGIVKLLCARNDDISSELEALEDINRRTASAETAEQLAELDFMFHQGLALASGNTLYALLNNTLKPAHRAFLTVFFREPGITGLVIANRSELIAALREKDAEKAQRLIIKLDSYESYAGLIKE